MNNFTKAKNKTADEWFDDANKAFDNGEYEKAIANYSKAIELDSDYVDLYYYILWPNKSIRRQ